MKKFFNVLLILFVSLFLLTNNVKADVKSINVGSETIYSDGQTVNLYGGKVTFDYVSEDDEYVLTLNNVNINDGKEYDSDGIDGEDIFVAIKYDESDLTIKLEGKNTITSKKSQIDSVYWYYAVNVLNNLKVIGTGSLDIKSNSGYDIYWGLCSNLISIGEEDKKGPTININSGNVSNDEPTVIAFENIKDIYNSNIKLNLFGGAVYGLYSAQDDPLNIKDSDIVMKLNSISGSVAIWTAFTSDINIENTDILSRGISVGNTCANYFLFYLDDIDAKIKNSRIVAINDDSGDNILVWTDNNSFSGIEFSRTNDSEFIFVANNKMQANAKFSGNITYDMVRTSTSTLDEVMVSSHYNDSGFFSDKTAMAITTQINNKVTSGNNKSLVKEDIESYSFETNHFSYLVENVKLDNTNLDEEDYELSKDGKVELTSTGIAKLKNLSLGTHKVTIEYYYGNSIEASFTLAEEYKVSFVSNGGSGTMDDVEKLSGTYTLPQSSFTAPTGKKFKGWSLTNNGSIITTLNMNEDKTVYAIWEDETYTITLTNDGNGTITSSANSAKYQAEITLTPNPNTGYKFVKWESEDVTITNNKFNMPDENVTINAVFELIKYKVSFVSNGGSGTMDEVKDVVGSYTLPDSTFTSPNKMHFKGWSLTSDGEVITTLNVSKDTTLYAIWEETYSYEYLSGNNQEFNKGTLNDYTFRIDGDYDKFKSLKIGNVNFVKDVDYTVTKGSTIITLTENGINKLNNLKSGTYTVETEFEDNTVTGNIVINNVEEASNPKTGDGITFNIIIGFISLLGLIGCVLFINKNKKVN